MEAYPTKVREQVLGAYERGMQSLGAVRRDAGGRYRADHLLHRCVRSFAWNAAVSGVRNVRLVREPGLDPNGLRTVVIAWAVDDELKFVHAVDIN